MAFENHDVVIDSPVNNFATFNRLATDADISDGSLRLYSSSSSKHAYSSISITTGKWYFEYMYTAAPSINGGGGITFDKSFGSGPENNGTRYIPTNGNYYKDGSHIGSAATYSTGDVIGVYVDADGGSLTYYKGGVSQVTISHSSLGSLPFYFYIYNYIGTQYGNFGQDQTFGGAKTDGGGFTDANGIGQFNYSTAFDNGALALCTKNIPSGPIDVHADDIPVDYFAAKAWHNNVDNVNQDFDLGFDADLLWVKRTDGPDDHRLYDSLRGENNFLVANGTGVQSNADYGVYFLNGNQKLTTDSTKYYGYGPATSGGSGNAFVAWMWKAAGAPASNEAKIIEEDGSLTVTPANTFSSNIGANVYPNKISANRKSGFSIVQYSGTQVRGHAVPHGLSQTPEMVLVKRYTNGGGGWSTFHSALYDGRVLSLSSDAGQSSHVPNAYWDDTRPNSSVVTLGYDGNGNEQNDAASYMMYCWHSVQGYSKIGYYNPDNVVPYFVELGFKPAFLLVKGYNYTSAWYIFDNARNTSNPRGRTIHPNSNGGQQDFYNGGVDFLSNGFAVRGTSSAPTADASPANVGSGYRIIYMAFAENPFNAPATAN